MAGGSGGSRHSIRLPGYDYGRPGAYFVTVNATEGLPLLDPEPVRQCILKVWNELPARFPGVRTDEFVVMPNHVHGVVWLGQVAGARDSGASGPITLARVVQAFKSLTTREYVLGVRHAGWPEFPGRLWQRNYYERVIRSETELGRVREYIRNNPARWTMDRENPAAIGGDEDGWLFPNPSGSRDSVSRQAGSNVRRPRQVDGLR